MNGRKIRVFLAGLFAAAFLVGCGEPPAEPTPTSNSNTGEEYPAPEEAPEQPDAEEYPLPTPPPPFDPYAEPEE
jgi:hypothetical protein